MLKLALTTTEQYTHSPTARCQSRHEQTRHCFKPHLRYLHPTFISSVRKENYWSVSEVQTPYTIRLLGGYSSESVPREVSFVPTFESAFFLRINIPQFLGLYHKFINAATSTWTHIRTLRTAHASSNVRHLSPLSMAKESSENWCIHRKRIPSSMTKRKSNTFKYIL